jgi:hypothetical protein
MIRSPHRFLPPVALAVIVAGTACDPGPTPTLRKDEVDTATPMDDVGAEDVGSGSDTGGTTGGAADDDDLGCTLSHGYWKNHPWPDFEGEILCGQSWLEILWTPPQGDAWYILAHQWIGAMLNVAAGAQVIGDMDELLLDAELMLEACSIAGGLRPHAIVMADELDDFNNGLLGVPHCDDGEQDDDDDDDDNGDDDDDCDCDDDDGDDDDDDDGDDGDHPCDD